MRGSKILTKSFYLQQIRKYKQFCVLLLLAKNLKIKMAAIFENCFQVGIVYSLDILGVEYFDEITLSPTVKETETILCSRTFSKNS